MSRKNRKNTQQGTYALCITAGLIIGVGIGAIMEQVLLCSLVGAAIGALAARYFNQQSQQGKRH
jgi:F0F1-type ATP synthase assembly protein I